MFLLGWKGAPLSIILYSKASHSIRVSLTILHLVGIGSTLFRFHYRYFTGRLWWDDYSSLLPLLMECAYAVTLWFVSVPVGASVSFMITNT